MEIPEDYIAKNRDAWNKRTEVHKDSGFYDMEGFLSGQNSLKDIELGLLGDIRGKTVLHLQCHFGQDSLSLARMGAEVTGADLSDAAIAKAREINLRLGLNAEFVCCDLYELPKHLDRKFDIVFTSYGTIGWLPDLDRWAKVVAHFLKPGGKFIFVEFHPVVWMFDPQFEKVAYNYFNESAIIETSTGTYTDRSAPIEYEDVSWNHDLGEVLSGLLDNGLEIDHFREYDYSPYDCFSNTAETEPGKFRIRHLGNKIPMTYSIRALKR